MAYEPTVWNCGDTITAEKMNKIEAELQTLSESGGGGGGEVSTDYITMSWTTGYGPEGDINGTFCGYEFESGFSFERDTETSAIKVLLSEIIPGEENPLPEEMFEICAYVLLNKLWSMLGDGTKDIDYTNWSFSSTDTLYNAFNGFDKTFTVSL